MNYEIKLPAIAGDIIPISAIARAMALRDATAGGPGGLRATYDGRSASYEAMLLKHVRSDSLAVCDHVGDCGKADDIVAQRVTDGMPVALCPDLREVDVDTTWLCNLFVKLKQLNDWASRRGDAFTVSHEDVPWVEAAHHVSRDGVSHFDVRHRGTSGADAPNAEPVPAVVPTGTGTKWTADRLAELSAYRDKHGTKAAAEHFGVSRARVRALLPIGEPPPKGFSAFTHRPK